MNEPAQLAHASARRDRGFSVVELMVSMAISLLLLAGVGAIFTSSKSTYETVERISRIQENGRFALDAIVRDIRSAGYVGCSRPSTFANTLNSQTQLSWNFDDAITGYDFQSGTTWLPALDASITNAAGSTNGSDALVLRVPAPSINSAPLRLTTKMSSPSGTLQIAPITGSQPGPLKANQQVIMVADCHARAVFEITDYDKATGVIEHAESAATATTPGNDTDDLKHAFEANSQIVPIQTVVYYIGTSAAGLPGLWRIVGDGAAEELIEGVERMELRFGEDTNGDRVADQYRRANEVSDWDNVIGVSVALLVRSPDEYGTRRDSQTYTLLDNTFTAPGDRHMRQIFATTATLRNRAL